MNTSEQIHLGPAFSFDFYLASVVASYPSSDFVETVRNLMDASAVSGPMPTRSARSEKRLHLKLKEILENPHQLEALRSEYIDRFDRGSPSGLLYESEYGRGRALVKGNQLADIAGFYRAFGLESARNVQPEMVDHIAVELEFYALLLYKSQALEEIHDSEGIEIVLDARKKFLKDHLSRFVDSLATHPSVTESPFYSLALGYCRDLVLDECERLGIVVEPTSWLNQQAEATQIKCGC